MPQNGPPHEWKKAGSAQDVARVLRNEPTPDESRRPGWVGAFWFALHFVDALAGGTGEFDSKRLPTTGETLGWMLGIAIVLGAVIGALVYLG
ncbi:MAG: hypothetical protein AAB974_03580 [Patescibacteria group bacterium]